MVLISPTPGTPPLLTQKASTTIFKKPIVHGMLAASHFSDLFGNTLPGIIYMS